MARKIVAQEACIFCLASPCECNKTQPDPTPKKEESDDDARSS